MAKKSKARVATDAATVMEAPLTVPATPPLASNEGTKHMTSILEFSQNVMEQEAPEPLPVGDYPATIQAASVETSKTSGNQYVAVQFRIDADSYPADYTDGNPDGTIITYNLTGVGADTPIGRFRLRTFIEAIGAKGGAKVDVTDWIGLSAVVSVTHEEWEGVNRARIARVISA